MIPMLLKVRNFMCYGEDVEPLMFDGIQLACLSGDNGNGKSALLDAITWALWGKARAADAELIHAGSSEMEVDFEFAIGAQRYRVIRKSTLKGSRTTGDCQFQMDDQGLYRVITGSNLRDTNRLISEVLHMSYDTFINSAFLLQGRADEFTRQTPGKRKEILTEILQLDRFDAWESVAKDESKSAKLHAEELRRTLVEIDKEIARRPAYEEELEDHRKRLDQAQTQMDLNRAMLDKLRVEAGALQDKLRLADDIEGRIRSQSRELQELIGRIEVRKKRIEQANLILARRAEIEQGYQELQDAREQERVLNETLLQVRELDLQRNRLQRAIDQARSELEGQYKVLYSKMIAAQEQVAKLPVLNQEYAVVQNENAELARLDCERTELQEQRQALANEKEVLKKVNEQLKPEADSIKEKIAILKKNGDQAACPVCNGKLSAQGLADLLVQFEEKLTQMRADYRANDQRIKQNELEIREQDRRLAEMEKRLRNKITVDRRLVQLETQIDAAEKEEESLGDLRVAVDKLSFQIRSGQYAEAEQTQLKDLDCRVNAFGYDGNMHEKMSERVKQLLPYEAQQRDLFNAFTLIQNEQENLSHEEPQVAGKERQIEEDRRRVQGLRDQAAGLPKLELQIRRAADEHDQAAKEWRNSNQQVAILNQRIHFCEEKAKERTALQSDLDTSIEDQKLYDDLATAFGKKGVPAMLIESVLPELEQEANTLLGKMTDNRMTVRFETQRNARSGDSVIETLEIKIHDGDSTRNYELFSGGESFRINFAIRIALSKLLARRSGASLQTLIIDEGFGTQDTTGRERLVEAIAGIQNDFQRILVITHIQELKDAFPVRIDIVKGPNGSQISVN